jgi:hypothetical protein
MTSIRRLGLCGLFALIALPGTASHAAVCNNVTFSLTNVSSGPIRITRVGYRDLDSGNPGRRWEQDVPDFSCPAGQTCFTTPRNLGSVTRPRENHELTDIQFLHSHQDAFGAWMAAVWSTPDVPASMTCTDGRNYGSYDVN